MTAGEHATRTALRTQGDEFTATWAEYAERVRAVAAGLAALGVGRGDTVGIMLTNRPEFHLVDTAAMHLGATPFSIYNTSTAEQIEYLFGRRRQPVARHRAGVPRHRPAAARGASALEHVVVVDGDPATARSRSRSWRPRRRGLRLRGGLAGGRARRPRDPDLHLRHDRAAEGGRADPRQRDRRRSAPWTNLPPARRRRPDLLAADGPHRRARRHPLLADRLRRHQPPAAPTRARSSPTCPKCARSGSSPCRASGRN